MKYSAKPWIVLGIIFSILLYKLSGQYDLLEKLLVFLEQHESWELDEFIILVIFWFILLFVYSIWQNRLLVFAKSTLEKNNEELRIALKEIERLEGIILICSNCHKVRIQDGSWKKIEEYISEKTAAKFSHGICKTCAIKLYPDLKLEDEDLN